MSNKMIGIIEINVNMSPTQKNIFPILSFLIPLSMYSFPTSKIKKPKKENVERETKGFEYQIHPRNSKSAKLFDFDNVSIKTILLNTIVFHRGLIIRNNNSSIEPLQEINVYHNIIKTRSCNKATKPTKTVLPLNTGKSITPNSAK